MSGRILTERLLATTSLAALILAASGQQHAYAVAPCVSDPGGNAVNSGAIACVVIDNSSTTSLTNAASGVIGPPSTGNSAIFVTSTGTLSGGIVNAGSIVGQPTGDGSTGIGVSGFVGGITNSGSISINTGHVGSFVTAYGINVGASTFVGTVSNSGTIAVVVNDDNGSVVGIVLQANTFTGAVLNSGMITVSAIGTGDSMSAMGVNVSNSGGVVSALGNSGTISVTATVASNSSGADAAGFAAFAPTLTGGFANSGTIAANATNLGNGLAQAQGASVLAYTWAGGFSNSGAITANASAPAGNATATGVLIGSGIATMSGGILNSGTIAGVASGSDATAHGLQAFVSTFSGNLSNSGTITASGAGNQDATVTAAAIVVSTFAGAIVNSGTVGAVATAQCACSTARAIGMVVNVSQLGLSGAGGAIVNTGSISARATGNTLANSGCASAIAVGLKVSVDTINGSITNAGGTITASATVLGGGAPNSSSVSHATATAVQINATLITGGIVNSGMIAATAANSGSGCAVSCASATAKAVGVNVTAATLTGGFMNSGTITASAFATGSLFAAATATGVGFSGGVSINGGVVNNGTVAVSAQDTASGTSSFQAAAKAYGIHGDITAGGLTNSGLISAAANFSGSCGIAFASAVNFIGGTITGLSNSGTISASAIATGASNAVAEASGIALGPVSISGSIVNSGQITAVASRTGGSSGVACAFGMRVEPSTMTGTITNSGSIVARASNPAGCAAAYGIVVEGGFSGTVANSGTIAGFFSGHSGAGVGILINGGTATIVNSGVIQGSTWGVSTVNESSASTINQTGGLITGGNSTSGGAIQLSTLADTVNISGGQIVGNIVGGGGTANIVNVRMGSGNTFSYAGQITNVGTVSVSSGTLLLQNMSAPGISAVKYTESAGATLALAVSPAATNNHAGIIAGTVAPASGSVLQAFEGAFAWTPGTYTYANVVTAGTISGSFIAASNSPFFTASLTQTGGGGIALPAGFGGSVSASSDTLTLTMLSPSQVPGLNSDQQSVANAIIGISGGNSTLDQLFTLSNPGPALTQLSGSQFTQMNYQPLIQAWQMFSDTLSDRLSQGGGYGGTVSARYDASHGLQFAQADVPQQVAQVSDGTPLRTTPMSHQWGVWARGYGLTSSAPSTATSAPYSESGSGLIIGADTQITDRIVAGVAVNIATDKATVTGGGFTQTNAYQGSAYGQYAIDPNWYVNGVAGFGWQNYSTARVVSLGTTMVNNGNFDGQSYRAYAETGYALHPAFLPQTRITPYLGLGYLHAHTEGFTETGSATALNVQAMDPNSFTTAIGARIAATWQIGSTVFRPELRAAWQHELLDETSTMRATFAVAPGSPAFTATGTSFGSDSFLGGAGITTTITSSTQLFVDYDAKVTGGYTAQAVSGGLRVQF